MIRLSTPCTCRFGLGIGRAFINFTGSRFITTTFTTTTTKSPTTTKSENESADGSPTELDLEEYMQQARAAFKKLESKPRILVDALSPRPSMCLSLALQPYLPRICRDGSRPDRERWGMSQGSLVEYQDPPSPVPPGHHLVYFPPMKDRAELMDDGTEKDTCPGAPFVRRLWAGGSIKFTPEWYSATLDHRPFYCLEKVGLPRMSGTSRPGKEAVYVTIQRSYLLDRQPLIELAQGSTPGKPPPVEETRDLVFLRQTSPQEKAKTTTTTTTTGGQSPIRTPIPDFSFELIPDNTLLFQFSALSYNAHAIHLNPEYARNVEGHEDLLVHGPLTLVLMLSALQGQCTRDQDDLDSLMKFPGLRWMIRSLDYRNIRPLLAGRKMKVCLSMKKEHNVENEICGFPSGKDVWTPAYRKDWKVWIEDSEGRPAVWATAVTIQPELAALHDEDEGFRIRSLVLDAHNEAQNNQSESPSRSSTAGPSSGPQVPSPKTAGSKDQQPKTSTLSEEEPLNLDLERLRARLRDRLQVALKEKETYFPERKGNK